MRFILVDRIVDMSPGIYIHAEKTMVAAEDFFRDHFPGFPVVPGVLLTEMMAQAAGKCLDAENPSRGKAMLVEIRRAGFRDWMLPGQTASIFADIKTSREKYATAVCRIDIEEKKISSAELSFSFVSSDRLAPDYVDWVLEAYLKKNNAEKKN